MNFSLGQKKEAMNRHELHALLHTFLYSGIVPQAHCILIHQSRKLVHLLSALQGRLASVFTSFQTLPSKLTARCEQHQAGEIKSKVDEDYEQSTESYLRSTAACIGSSYRRLCLRRYSTMRHRLQAVPAFHKLDMRSW